jgi:hypothetical protein
MDGATGDKPRRIWGHSGSRLTAFEYRLWVVGFTIFVILASIQGGLPLGAQIAIMVYVIGFAHIRDDSSPSGDVLVNSSTFSCGSFGAGFLFFAISWWAALIWLVAWTAIFQVHVWVRQRHLYRLATLLRVTIPLVGWLVFATIGLHLNQ